MVHKKLILNAVNEGIQRSLIDFDDDTKTLQKVKYSDNSEYFILSLIKDAIQNENLFIPKRIQAYDIGDLEYSISIEQNTLTLYTRYKQYGKACSYTGFMIELHGKNMTMHSLAWPIASLFTYGETGFQMDSLAQYAHDFEKLKQVAGCGELVYKCHVLHIIDDSFALSITDQSAAVCRDVIQDIQFVCDFNINIANTYDFNNTDTHKNKFGNKIFTCILQKKCTTSPTFIQALMEYMNKFALFVFPDREYFNYFKLCDIYEYNGDIEQLESEILRYKVKFDIVSINAFKNDFSIIYKQSLDNDKEITRKMFLDAENYRMRLCKYAEDSSKIKQVIVQVCQKIAYILYFSAMPFYKNYIKICYDRNFQPSEVYSFNGRYSNIHIYEYFHNILGTPEIANVDGVNIENMLDITETIYNFLLAYGIDKACEFTESNKRGSARRKALKESAYGKSLIDFDSDYEFKKVKQMPCNIKQFHFKDYVYYSPEFGYNNFVGEKVAICLSDQPRKKLYMLLRHELMMNPYKWTADYNILNKTVLPDFKDGWKNTQYIKNTYPEDIKGSLWEQLGDNEYVPSINELNMIYNICDDIQLIDETGFSPDKYWTSSCYKYPSFAYAIDFDGGVHNALIKRDLCYTPVLLHIENGKKKNETPNI